MSADTPSPDGATKRGQPETLRARDLTASFTVNDLQKSLAWYRDVAGFIVGEKYDRDGKLMGVSLKAGDVQIFIGQDDGAKGLSRVKGLGMSHQLSTAQDIDGIANRIKAAGGTLATEPADMPWGVRVFRIKDPDGFMLVISSIKAG